MTPKDQRGQGILAALDKAAERIPIMDRETATVAVQSLIKQAYHVGYVDGAHAERDANNEGRS